MKIYIKICVSFVNAQNFTKLARVNFLGIARPCPGNLPVCLTISYQMGRITRKRLGFNWKIFPTKKFYEISPVNWYQMLLVTKLEFSGYFLRKLLSWKWHRHKYWYNSVIIYQYFPGFGHDKKRGKYIGIFLVFMSSISPEFCVEKKWVFSQ